MYYVLRNNMAQKDWPQWVFDQKEKGTEIHARQSGYFKYRVTCKYDPTTKKRKKITGEYLGKLSPEGLIPPKYKRVLRSKVDDHLRK